MIFIQQKNEPSQSYSYFITDPITKQCCLVNPRAEHYARDWNLVNQRQWHVVWCLETCENTSKSAAHLWKKEKQSRIGLPPGKEQPQERHWVEGDLLSLGQLTIRPMELSTDGYKQVAYVINDDKLIIDLNMLEQCTNNPHQSLTHLPGETLIYPTAFYQQYACLTLCEFLQLKIPACIK